MEMDKNSKILIITVFVLIGLSVVFTFYRTMVAKDYPVIKASK